MPGLTPWWRPEVEEKVRLELQQQGSNVMGYFITTGQQAMLMTTPEPIEGRVAGDMVTFKSG